MALHPDVKKYYVFRALLKRFILPILVLYGLDRGLTLSELSLIAAVGSVLSFVLEVPSGALADRFGHRRALVLSMFGQALSMFLYLGGSFWWILLGTTTYFGFSTLMTGTAEAFFYERVKQLDLTDQHAKLYGAGKGFATGVSILSMLLAGVFYEIAWELPFVIGILQFLVAAWVISSMGNTHDEISVQKKEAKQTTILRHFSSAFHEVWKRPELFWMIVASALIMGPLFAVGDFQQAVMSDVGLSASLIGVVYAIKRGLSVLVQGSTHQLMRFMRPPLFLLVSAMIMVVHYVGVGLIEDPWLIQAPLLIGSLAWVGLEIAVNDYINRSTETSSRATLLSMNNFFRSLVSVFTIALFGFITTPAPAAHGFLVLGIVFSVLLVIPLVMLFRQKRAFVS
ncbi:MFS transporter [Candidatus Uhrbacteria bacterium]|nr:MFS transporter [Candidatus Uhrbacteria bacterium]